MKIDLAVWTAVNGYDWQPGSVYSPKELAGYKDGIGPLVPDSLPLGGLFLKDGKAVFYRVQIAERMDSRGRGAIYCVLGTVPGDKAKEIDFQAVFGSAEMSNPRKPFPTSIEYDPGMLDFKSPLGRSAFDERRFTGPETFPELGGWCEEAKGGKLDVRITGSMDAPLFTVKYKPHAEPVAEPPKPPPSPVVSRAMSEYRDGMPPFGHCGQTGQPRMNPSPIYGDDRHVCAEGPSGAHSVKPFLKGFLYGAVFGMVATVLLKWLVWPSK